MAAPPANVDEYAQLAHEILPRNALDYYRSGATDMVTLRDNRAAFQRYALRPRILRDVSRVDTSTTILGRQVACPICVAPTAMQRMAHPDGEEATARACAAAGACMTLSSWSTTSLEDTAAAGGPDALRWMQLYVYKDREVTRRLVERAEAAGYAALAVTVDTPVLGRREADVRNKFALPPHLTMANFGEAGGEFAGGVNAAGAESSGLASYVASLIDPSITWDDIAWLRSLTRLPIVVKGVMTAADAALAVEHGCEGVWVSNHGGRQLDTVAATIDALQECVAAVAGRAEVYLDGGVVRGADAVKAVCMGARAVFIGRPVLWGLAVGGEAGVAHVLQLLFDEWKMTQQLLGCATVGEMGGEYVQARSGL